MTGIVRSSTKALAMAATPNPNVRPPYAEPLGVPNDQDDDSATVPTFMALWRR